MHGPMLQGSVHNSWKLKTSQFLHGQHTHRTCHSLSMFGMFWVGVYDSVFWFLPISCNFTQPLKRSGPTFHRPQSTTWSTLCERNVLANGGHTRYWLVFGPPDPQFWIINFKMKSRDDRRDEFSSVAWKLSGIQQSRWGWEVHSTSQERWMKMFWKAILCLSVMAPQGIARSQISDFWRGCRLS